MSRPVHANAIDSFNIRHWCWWMLHCFPPFVGEGWLSPCAAEFYEIWHTRSAHRRNHVCQIFSRSVQRLYRVLRPPKLPFPIDLLRRPYNGVALPCDTVINNHTTVMFRFCLLSVGSCCCSYATRTAEHTASQKTECFTLVCPSPGFKDKAKRKQSKDVQWAIWNSLPCKWYDNKMRLVNT